jgi:hypothetical protein
VDDVGPATAPDRVAGAPASSESFAGNGAGSAFWGAAGAFRAGALVPGALTHRGGVAFLDISFAFAVCLS